MKSFLPFITLSILLAPILVFGAETASDYTHLVTLPVGDNPTLGSYVNTLYLVSISLAAMLAVLKIIIAGVKYMLSDVVTNKGEALKEIRTSLLGLLLIISAVMVLQVINPNLIKTNVIFDKRIQSEDSNYKGTSPGVSSSNNQAIDKNSKTTTDGAGNQVTTTDLAAAAEEIDIGRRRVTTEQRDAIQLQEATATAEKTCTDKYGQFTVSGTTGTCTPPKSAEPYVCPGSSGNACTPTHQSGANYLAEWKKSCTDRNGTPTKSTTDFSSTGYVCVIKN